MRFKYINKQVVAGFVGKSVELRYMPSGDAVLDLSVATTHSWKDKNNEWHDDAEWHNCIFYRKQAEEVAAEVQPGAAIYVEGRTYTRRWSAKDGGKRSRKEIIADAYHLIHHIRSEKTTDAPPDDNGADMPPTNMAGFDQD